MRQQHDAQCVDQRWVVARAFQLAEAIPHRTDWITVPGQPSQEPLRDLWQVAVTLPDRHSPLGLTSAWIARRRLSSSTTRVSLSALAPWSALSRNSLTSASPGVRRGSAGERVVGTSVMV